MGEGDLKLVSIDGIPQDEESKRDVSQDKKDQTNQGKRRAPRKFKQERRSASNEASEVGREAGGLPQQLSKTTGKPESTSYLLLCAHRPEPAQPLGRKPSSLIKYLRGEAGVALDHKNSPL